ncbi:hypothetical protein AMTRI_Chr04g180560 [Amborella trichopoda]
MPFVHSTFNMQGYGIHPQWSISNESCEHKYKDHKLKNLFMENLR